MAPDSRASQPASTATRKAPELLPASGPSPAHSPAHLQRPDLHAARAAVLRVLPGMFEDLWPSLLAHAGLTGTETDDQAIERLLHAMRTSKQPVLNVCAMSLTIRLGTYDHHTRQPSPTPELSRPTPTTHTPKNERQARPTAVTPGPCAGKGGTAAAAAPAPPASPCQTEEAWLDTAGVIVRVNQAWTEFTLDNGGHPTRTGPGTSYLAACAGDNTDALSQAIGAAIRSATRGRLENPVNVLLPCHSPTRKRWYTTEISSRHSSSGHCVGATIRITPAPS